MQNNDQIDLETQVRKIGPCEYLQILSQMNDIYEQTKYSQTDSAYQGIVHDFKNNHNQCLNH